MLPKDSAETSAIDSSHPHRIGSSVKRSNPPRSYELDRG